MCQYALDYSGHRGEHHNTPASCWGDCFPADMPARLCRLLDEPCPALYYTPDYPQTCPLDSSPLETAQNTRPTPSSRVVYA